MAPDLNSLPPSNPPSPLNPSRTSSSPSITTPGSLPNASPSPSATSSANPPNPLQQHGSRPYASPRQQHRDSLRQSSPRQMLERRSSSGLGSFSLGDGVDHGHGHGHGHGSSGSSPVVGGGGPATHSAVSTGSASSSLVTADPHHARTPSLGELHQELENEQEAQVNRLLHLIRQQQAQLDSLTSHAAHDAPGPVSATTASSVAPGAASRTPSSSRPTSATPAQMAGRSSVSLSRQSSTQDRSRAGSAVQAQRSPSLSGRGRPPSLQSGSGGYVGLGMGEMTHERDEVALCQAETAMVQRENAMLKARVRELERLVEGLRGSAVGTS